jgi:hypothetical protein
MRNSSSVIENVPSDSPAAPPGCAGSAGIPDGTAEHSPSRGIPVTPPASTPLVEEFQFLLCGIDSLDLGLYVAWGSDWKRRLHSLDKKKQQARKNGGLLISMQSGRNCIFKPGGKGENYRFHLQFDAYNLFIGKAARPGTFPNVYLSISAKILWQNGIETALSWITEDLKAIGGGTIQLVQVSRLDLCADFLVPGGLSHEFILSHKVTRNDKGKLYLDKNELETYYAADAKSPIQLRIYNKGLEVKQGGVKLWFLDLWKREATDDIWRIEYQVRRPALKQFGINSIDDLKEKQAGLWGYLTTKWFSLRLPDNDKAERKTIHPFWFGVQECFKIHVPDSDSQVHRDYGTSGTTSPEWHLSHIDGCLSSFAAFLGITNRLDALQELQSRLTKRNNAADFETACIKKAIQRGTLSEGGGR